MGQGMQSSLSFPTLVSMASMYTAQQVKALAITLMSTNVRITLLVLFSHFHAPAFRNCHRSPFVSRKQFPPFKECVDLRMSAILFPAVSK